MSFESGGHFYDHDGNSAHEVDDPKNPGTLKKTGIKDARRLQLCPSTTGVQKVQNSEGLNIYGKGKNAHAGADNKALRGTMPDWQWEKLCRSKASIHASDAADAGTQFHLVVESIINNTPLPDYELTIPEEFFSGFCEFWEESGLTVIATELGFCHPMGYGGRIDLVAEDGDHRLVIADWKSKETKGKTKSKLFYEDSQPVQLVAYAEGYQESTGKIFIPHPRLLTVIISRDEPGRIEYKYWPEEKYTTYRDQFRHQLGLWKILNNYDAGWEE